MSDYESIYPDIVPMPLSAFAPSGPPASAFESSMNVVKGAIPELKLHGDPRLSKSSYIP